MTPWDHTKLFGEEFLCERLRDSAGVGIMHMDVYPFDTLDANTIHVFEEIKALRCLRSSSIRFFPIESDHGIDHFVENQCNQIDALFTV